MRNTMMIDLGLVPDWASKRFLSSEGSPKPISPEYPICIASRRVTPIGEWVWAGTMANQNSGQVGY